jgi:hypothetical protein
MIHVFLVTTPMPVLFNVLRHSIVTRSSEPVAIRPRSAADTLSMTGQPGLKAKLNGLHNGRFLGFSGIRWVQFEMLLGWRQAWGFEKFDGYGCDGKLDETGRRLA